MKIGIIGEEFFSRGLDRFGGYGWAARQVANCFAQHPELGIDVIFLTNYIWGRNGEGETSVDGTRLLLHQHNRFDQARRVRAEKIDLLLAIDYNPGHRFFYGSLPRTPAIIWVRAPRTPEDLAIIATLRIPGAEQTRPQGIVPVHSRSLAWDVRLSRWIGRPMLFATPAPYLATKMPGAYGVTPRDVFLLPNIVTLDPGTVTKNARPLVAFLGRLDPIKRPWLAIQLAEHFPDVDFVLMGKAHFEGEGVWMRNGLPPNVRLAGHADEDEKRRTLSAAWILLNTSICEGLAVSMLEALACETPIVSCCDAGGVVSRFGRYVGQWNGTGAEGLGSFVDALRSLLEDASLRGRLGKAGRAWVQENHSQAHFLERFAELCGRIGLR
jgi:glycosyltransferase involved in cell wall biosynthesis